MSYIVFGVTATLICVDCPGETTSAATEESRHMASVTVNRQAEYDGWENGKCPRCVELAEVAEWAVAK